MYLTREQEWRNMATDEHARLQCDLRTEPSQLPPLRIPPETMVQAEPVEEAAPPAAPRKFERIGNLIRMTRRVARQTWEVAAYGIPVSMGIVSGMVRNNREVRYAPVIFTMLFLSATWGPAARSR